MSSRWCGVVVRRGGVPVQVMSSSFDDGSKLRSLSPKALVPPRILFYFKGVCGATTPQKTGYAQDVKHPLGRLFRTQYVYCTTWLENRPWIWTRFMI
ncbi:hypothetical protein TNCV_4397521 [Trichonephila clavipes]|nr:hypothetical protein TNCV_4397521 [Trichonephila clavipes]